MTAKCPNCEWSAEVPDEKIPAEGGKGTCPKCQTKFEVKKDAKLIIEPPPVFSSPAHSDTKPCPLCGEEILNIAKKCKHCKSMLVDSLDSKPNEEPILSSPQGFKNITDLGKCSDCGETLNDSGFCAKCGVLQVRKNMKGTSGNNSKYETKPSNTASVVKTTLIVVVTLAVIAGVVNFSIYHLSGKADVDKAERRAVESQDRALALSLLESKIPRKIGLEEAMRNAWISDDYGPLKALISQGTDTKKALFTITAGFTDDDLSNIKKLVSFLLENGADINVKNDSGYEILCKFDHGSDRNDAKMAEFLVAKGGICSRSPGVR